MRFSCLKDHLARSLSIAERFTGKNISMPVLGNVLLESGASSLSIHATNLEYGISIQMPGQGTKEGRVSVPAKIVSSLVQSVREEKVDLESKAGGLFIKTENREVRVNGTDPEEFPLLPKIKKTYSFVVEGAALGRGLESVLPAVALSEFKPELSGVFFKASAKTLYLVATDTFRLAQKIIDLPRKSEEGDAAFIAPFRLCQEIARIVGEVEDEELKLSIGENQLMLESARLKIISRLIDGSFPDYTRIIPKNFDTTTFLSRTALIDSLRAAAICASRLQDVSLEFRGKKLQITSQNPEIGEYKTSLDSQAVGKEMATSFNYRYLLDGLTALDEEDIFFGLNSQELPALVRNKTEESFIYVVMPIRLT